MDAKTWFKSLLAAFIQAAATSISVIIVDPVAFNFTTQWKKTAMVAVVCGIVGAALYLKDSPLPGYTKPTMRALLIPLVAFGLLASSACDKAKAQSVQRQIVLNTDRVASNIGNAIDAVGYMRANGTITNSAATTALQRIQEANAANKQIIGTLERYLVVNADGSKTLKLTEDGKVDARKAIDEAVNAFNSALADPILNASGNQALSALANALRLAVKAVIEVREQLKPKVAWLFAPDGTSPSPLAHKPVTVSALF